MPDQEGMKSIGDRLRLVLTQRYIRNPLRAACGFQVPALRMSPYGYHASGSVAFLLIVQIEFKLKQNAKRVADSNP